METAVTIKSGPSLRTPDHGLRARPIVLGLFLAALWFILCRHLSNEWSANEQYSYGWFVPFFAAYLFWLRWESRPKANGYSSTDDDASRIANYCAMAVGALVLFILLPLRAFEIGNPDWRPLGWIHAAIVVGLTLGLIWRIGGGSWLRHFAFPVAFIFVAVPWITPVEEPIVQGLMRVVAAIASETVNLLGIPAQLEGSVIRISSGVVGVNEACSGVRSLQTSLMIGLLFGELKQLPVLRRIALVVAAAAIAFSANCVRAFFLVWMAATRGVEAVGQWHDAAGYAILLAVFAGTMGVAALLARTARVRKTKFEDTGTTIAEPRAPLPSPSFPFRIATFAVLLWLLLVEGGVEFWYRSHERDLVSTPAWSARWPEQAPGFREIKIDENVRSTLRYDTGRQATWPLFNSNTEQPMSGSPRPSASCSMFAFRWEPGTTSILRARAHRPDICLPNTGWKLSKDSGVRTYPMQEGRGLTFRHFIFERETGTGRMAMSAHAFFSEREDRVPAGLDGRIDVTEGSLGDWSRSDRLRVVRDGLRNQGQQVLEVVLLTARPVESEKAENEFAALVPQIVK